MRIEVVPSVLIFCTRSYREVCKANVRSVEELAERGIAVEEVFEMEDGTISHRIARQTLDELRMAAVDYLKGVALMMDARPGISQLRQLLHFLREGVGRGGENFIIVTRLIMGAVDMHSPSRANAIPDKLRPL